MEGLEGLESFARPAKRAGKMQSLLAPMPFAILFWKALEPFMVVQACRFARPHKTPQLLWPCSSHGRLAILEAFGAFYGWFKPAALPARIEPPDAVALQLPWPFASPGIVLLYGKGSSLPVWKPDKVHTSKCSSAGCLHGAVCQPRGFVGFMVVQA